ncbi:MAG TPA: DUF6600 domain-containing protein [Pyrinomonadaceae bacterium]|jgi:hypothetical protein
MHSAKRFLWAAFFFLPLLFFTPGNVCGAVVDDYTPEVTARVARISFIRGDVQIRRPADEDGAKTDWERAALNLPLVEGDELATGANAVVEIQLDGYNHIRLWENAYLKFTTLGDEGIAVSLPQGTLNFRARSFDKAKSYFEIDAPNATVSIEKAGMYRIESGDTRNTEIRVAASEDGEAKVYTESAGFTLRSGRAARIFIAGNYAGDYETETLARTADEFDEWVLQRDALVAKRLSEAYYDKYYDRDQFGAEDLNEHGEWIYTKKYGYVWKPFANAISGYADWSPYRYGHWRWVPFYGWTWVNDEPWGWATYHHGRWVWDNGYWVWTPYAAARWRRSWWQPAMISIVTWNGRVLWYPLGYDDNYCDFNRGYGGYGRYRRNRRNNVTIINNNTTVVVNPTPTPGLTQQQINDQRRRSAQQPSFNRVPPGAVVELGVEEFGKQRRGNRTASLQTAKQVLASPIDENQPPPALPEYKTIKSRISREILIENPRIDDRQAARVRTGAETRENGKALNQKLENQRIFGNRQPKVVPDVNQNPTPTEQSEPRRTGAVNRRPAVRQDGDSGETRPTPGFNPRSDEPTRTRREEKPTESRQEEQPPVRQRPRENRNAPVFQPQPERPREEEPPREERRRSQPTFPQPEQRREEPRREQPRREEPRPQPRPETRQEQPRPEPRREQPAPRPEPKPEQKPTRPSVVERKSKDN